MAEERAWKAFGLVPLLLLHRPRGCGSIGRDELALRADRFARRQLFELLEDAQNHVPVRAGSNPQDQTRENARRGRAAQSRVERGQVSRARQELTGAALAPKTADTLRELQEKRPVAQVREIPPVVLVAHLKDLSTSMQICSVSVCPVLLLGPPQDQEGAQTRC